MKNKEILTAALNALGYPEKQHSAIIEKCNTGDFGNPLTLYIVATINSSDDTGMIEADFEDVREILQNVIDAIQNLTHEKGHNNNRSAISS